MEDGPGTPQAARFFVEVHRPGIGWTQLETLIGRAREGAEAVTRDGRPVRFMRSVFVPQDDTCFFLYEAVSADAVVEAGRRSELSLGPVQAPLEL